MAAFELEDFWEDLLACIEERRVIPIVGPDLLTVQVDGVERPYQSLIASKLAERLRVAAPLPEVPSLNDVVVRYLQERGRREEVYPRIRSIVREIPAQVPPLLESLAAIRHFDLFVSLTFDALLVEAINRARYDGESRTEHLAFAPSRPQDLPVDRTRLGNAVVFGLLGKLSVSPDFAITEEDILEFLCALQEESKRPPLLSDELRRNHLLIIGCGFPDWLTRFFLRIVKARQLSSQRGEMEVLVDREAEHERTLTVFLESYSYGTRIYPGSTAQFVAELSRRWGERHPEGEAPAPHERYKVEVEDMRPGSVFVSYAKEDHESAVRLQRALGAAGIDVWFDKDRLGAGDLYDQKIRRNIKSCSLFVPIISANALARVEGYFRREWKLAEERMLGIAENIPFLIPVVVDDTEAYAESVPVRFQDAQWTRLAGGVATPEFEQRMVRLVRDVRKRERSLA